MQVAMVSMSRIRMAAGRWAAALALMFAGTPMQAQEPAAPLHPRGEARPAPVEDATAGRLRVLGEYQQGRKAWTSTVLPDGGVLLFGDRVLDDALRRHAAVFCRAGDGQDGALDLSH